MKVVFYDEKTKTYTPEFEVDTILYNDDMDKMVQCPMCKKYHKFGDMINSGNYFSANPLGVWRVPVCPECAEKIWAAESKKNVPHAPTQEEREELFEGK